MDAWRRYHYRRVRPIYLAARNPLKERGSGSMTVPVSVNGHSTGTMSMSSEFNIAKSKLSISDFPFTYGVPVSLRLPDSKSFRPYQSVASQEEANFPIFLID
jgi:hypothetical protein